MVWKYLCCDICVAVALKHVDCGRERVTEASVRPEMTRTNHDVWRRVTSAAVVRGLECYNVTIATGRFRLKRWNVTLYHRRRESVLNVTMNRNACLWCSRDPLQTNICAIEKDDLSCENSRICGDLSAREVFDRVFLTHTHHVGNFSDFWISRALLRKYFLMLPIDPEQLRWSSDSSLDAV